MAAMPAKSGIFEHFVNPGSAVPFPRPIPAEENHRDESMNAQCANDRVSQWKGSENETTAVVPT